MKNPSTERDKALFARVARGDAAAFEQLFGLYYNTLFRNALKILKSTFWAEEIVQEVFLQLWSSRAALADVEAPDAYLFRVSANRCLDRMRRRHLELKAQYLLLQSMASNEQAPQQGYDFARLQQLVREAMAKLPPQQLEAYRLQQEEGLSYQQIAVRMGLSRNTVRNHLSKALHAIRLYIQEHGDAMLLLFFTVPFF